MQHVRTGHGQGAAIPAGALEDRISGGIYINENQLVLAGIRSQLITADIAFRLNIGLRQVNPFAVGTGFAVIDGAVLPPAAREAARSTANIP